MTRLWILGSNDPEMTTIEALLRECGEEISYATIGGRRVTAGEAYRADATRVPESCDGAGDLTVYIIECGLTLLGLQHDDHYTGRVVRIDHHRHGDPGFGAPPKDFLRASSLGQVIAELALLGLLRWPVGPLMSSHVAGTFAVAHHQGDMVRPDIDFVTTCEPDPEFTDFRRTRIIPRDLVITAAADHCLGHAYAGRCPGVDPDELMRWRVESRAKFQGRSTDEILADIAAAKVALEDAPWTVLGSASEYDICVRDMRGRHVPELPEAGTRYGIPYLADGLPDTSGRVKTVCSGSAEVVRAFIEWAPRNGLVDCYGDPERGFAGAHSQGGDQC